MSDDQTPNGGGNGEEQQPEQPASSPVPPEPTAPVPEPVVATPPVTTSIPPLPEKSSDGFFDKYGDKILSAVIGGIVGFFTAIMATKGDVSKLNERVVAIETQDKNTEPKLKKLDQNLREMELLKQKLEILEKKDETATMISKSLEERLKNVQIQTLKELKELLAPQQQGKTP